MIPFDEIDIRLKALKRTRAWLAEASERKPDSIRVALAPNAPNPKRSRLLQKALSDAIEREEAAKEAETRATVDRLTFECDPSERRRWSQAALCHTPPMTVEDWALTMLNLAAEGWAAAPKLGALPEPERAAPEKQA